MVSCDKLGYSDGLHRLLIFGYVGKKLRATRLRPHYVPMALARGAKRPSKPSFPQNAQNILRKNAIVDCARGVGKLENPEPYPPPRVQGAPHGPLSL